MIPTTASWLQTYNLRALPKSRAFASALPGSSTRLSRLMDWMRAWASFTSSIVAALRLGTPKISFECRLPMGRRDTNVKRCLDREAIRCT